MSVPRHECCPFPMWEEIDGSDTMWTCGSCGCIWDEYGGIITEGNSSFGYDDEEILE